LDLRILAVSSENLGIRTFTNKLHLG
jgi:hypothetical protein